MSRESTLVDRLRGVYTVPVNDGAGLLNGKDTFTRAFEVAPIQKEAADEIERLRSRIAKLESERDSLRDRDCALAHVVLESCVTPGVSYSCRCDECRSVAKNLDEAGFLESEKDRWWVDSPADSIGDVKGDKR